MPPSRSSRPLWTALALAAAVTALVVVASRGGRGAGAAATGAEAPPAGAPPAELRGTDAPEAAAARRAVALAEEAADATPADAAAFDPAALSGTVVDEDGAPVAGATVRLLPVDEPGALLASAETDAAGRFRIGGLEPHRVVDVLGTAAGFLPRRVEHVAGTDVEVELGRGAPLAGRVLDAATEAPLAGVELAFAVLAWREDALAEDAVVVSDAAGAYALPVAPLEGRLQVVARRPGAAPTSALLQLRADAREGYDLRLAPPHEVVLEVRDADTDRPVADAALEVRVDGERSTAATDGAGRALVRVAAVLEGGTTLQVAAEGWCTTVATLSPEELADGSARVPLLRGAAVRGRVVDEDGAPVARARVETWPQRWTAPRLGERASVLPDAPDVRTGADGTFAVLGLVPDDQPTTVRASHPERGWSAERRLVLASSGDEEVVELVLRRGATIEGRTTSLGAPVAAAVRWSAERTGGRVRSNDAGAYVVRGVPPGTVHLHVEALGDARRRTFGSDSPTATFVVEADETVRQDLELGEPTGLVRGRVVAADGTPVAGVLVHAQGRRAEGRVVHAQARADEDGAFVVATGEDASATFVVWAADGRRRAAEHGVRVGGPDLVLALPDRAAVRLAVADARTRAPLVAFRVYAREAGEGPLLLVRTETGLVAPGGLYELELEPGLWDVCVSSRELGYLPQTVERAVVERGGDAVVPFLLEPGVTVEVAARPEDPGDDVGQPLLRLVREDERRLLEDDGGAYGFARVELRGARRIDPHGTTTLRGLAPGTYRWHGRSDGYAVAPEEVVVPAVDLHRVEVVWRRVAGGGTDAIEAEAR